MFELETKCNRQYRCERRAVVVRWDELNKRRNEASSDVEVRIERIRRVEAVSREKVNLHHAWQGCAAFSDLRLRKIFF